MEFYKGCYISIEDNNDINYPYIAISKVGNQDIKKKGYSKQEAIDLAKQEIDFIIGIIEMKRK